MKNDVLIWEWLPIIFVLWLRCFPSTMFKKRINWKFLKLFSILWSGIIKKIYSGMDLYWKIPLAPCTFCTGFCVVCNMRRNDFNILVIPSNHQYRRKKESMYCIYVFGKRGKQMKMIDMTQFPIEKSFRSNIICKYS